MSARGTKVLAALLAGGLLARVVVAFATDGAAFDIEAYSLVRDALASHPLDVYGSTDRWPYPPGYFAWILAASGIEHATRLDFSDLVQLPAIFADVAIAWIVQNELGRRGADERTRLVAAALVAFGPLFFVISAYHGQIDSIAILPALIAVLLWQRDESPRRALWAGLLLGLGGLLKTVPLVVVLALLPSVKSRREGATLLAATVVLPLAAFVPFLVADPAGVEAALRYRGVPGAGGLSMIVQPDLARAWMNEVPIAGNGMTTALIDVGGLITAAALAVTAWLLARWRPDPAVGVAMLCLVLWVFGVNFFPQYVIWGLPFLLIAGYLREVAFIQLVMVPSLILIYLRPWESITAAYAFVPASLAIWAISVVGLLVVGRRAAAPAS